MFIVLIQAKYLDRKSPVAIRVSKSISFMLKQELMLERKTVREDVADAT
jgi:hypothetical protein